MNFLIRTAKKSPRLIVISLLIATISIIVSASKWETFSAFASNFGTANVQAETNAPKNDSESVNQSFKQAEKIVPGTCDTAGPIEVESSGGTPLAQYVNLGTAFTVINTGVHTGTITIDVCGDTDELTLSATLNASGSGAASYTSIVISPAGGAARTITGATVAGSPLIDFNGADNVTINGLNTGGNSLTISNTTASATSGTSTIRFIGGATNNLITNSNIQGSGTMSVATNGATIFFSTDAVTANGNDNNTISNNNIGPAGANLPTKAILGNGSTTTTAIGNSGIVINNNNIFDFFGAAVTSSGVATNGGCNTWSITNNRFYQTAPRTWTTGSLHIGIDIRPTTSTSGAQGFTITGNTVGYASNTQTGTYTLTGAGTGAKFIGIFFNGISSGTASNVNNNTVAAVSMTGVTSSGTSTATPFTGILFQEGNGITNGNTIGSQSATSSLTFSTTTTSSTDVYGIYNFSSNAWTSNTNNVGGISVTNLGASGTFLLYGMRAFTASTTTWTAASNNVGGTVANSIQLTATGTASQIVGMFTSNAPTVLTTNNIRNLTTNIGTGTSTTASAVGILVTSTTPNHTMSRNTISNLTNTNATAASVVTGIQFTGASANLVERNLITDLTVATNSTAAEVNGIRINGGTTVYRNNMINLGAGINNAIGTGATQGISGIFEFLGTNTIYHNSIYIGGSPTAGTGASYAFNGQQTVSTRSFRNNIFFNARSNSGATGANYAVRVGGSAPNPGGLTINNNVYFANGTGAVFGRFNNLDVANLAAWQAAVGQDANSIEANPLFASTVSDLPLSAGSPARDIAANLGVTNDYYGDARPGANALFDIGADEFDGTAPIINDAQATAFIDPANGGFKLAGATFSPQASFTNNGVNNLTNVTVRYRICADAACTTEIYNQTTVILTLNAGATVTASFPSTSIATVGTYYIRARAELVGDTVPANDEIAGTLNISTPLSGTYTVGAGGNFPSLTNGGGVFDTINNLGATSNLTINITSDLTTETGAVALNQLAGGFTVTIKPSGAPRSITGATVGNTGLIRLNGADNVTIDGSLSGGNDRSLTIQNTNTTTGHAVIQIVSLGAGAGATDNTVKNTILRGGTDTSVSTLITYGISNGGATPGATGADNDNASFVNNDIAKVAIGIYSAGETAANQNQNTYISKNLIGSAAFGADQVWIGGIVTPNTNLAAIVQNEVRFVGVLEPQTNGGGSIDKFGISAGFNTGSATSTTAVALTNSNISNNLIHDIVEENTFSALGISVSGGNGAAATNNIVANNMIYNVRANGTAGDTSAGIMITSGNGDTVVYNSIYNTGDLDPVGSTTSSVSSFGIQITNTTAISNLTLQNNISYVDYTSNTATLLHGSIFITGTGVFAAGGLDYNDEYVLTTNAQSRFARVNTTDYTTFGAYQTAVTPLEANSISANPQFVSATDLHILPTSPAADEGNPITSVPRDFDLQLRATGLPPLGGGTTDIGADEIFAPTAANVEISGRITTASGEGIRNATVMLTGGTLTEPVYVRTGTFGIYRFADLPVGQTYVITVISKRYTFANPSRVINLTDNATEENFEAEAQ